ncbi:MAG: SDR family oxidoreductase [Acidimicrobiia bacterium]|jgi:uncharacterized protein YbjT (DUF2867 family)
MRVLVTGATGYIGGRLVPQLLDAGLEVRCMARQPQRLALHPWRDRVEVVAADASEPDTLDAAMAGCEAAFYLIHSMDGSGDFARRDREAAANVAAAAERAGLRRIVYLGGLGRAGDDLSEHLGSRHEVGRILAAGATPVTEVRAAVIIGSGSVSFEMLRHLTEVLPVMVTPKWVSTRCQPIAVRDVLTILIRALEEPEPVDRLWEVGGPDVLTYEQMMRVYAEVAGLPRRVIMPVPVLTPRLSSRWVGLVTPLPSGVARPLIDSLAHEVVVEDDHTGELLGRDPIPYHAAVSLALERVEHGDVVSRWSDAVRRPAAPLPTDPAWSGATWLRDVQTVETRAPAADVFWAVARIGGEVGYYAADWAWRLRGLLDTLVGGVGLRRGRRHPIDLRPGEALDFWRVADVVPGRRLLLAAEMRLPGEAWLEFEIEDQGDRRTLRQTAHFVPRGLFGRIYWYGILPFHVMVFGPMARRIVGAAERRSVTGEPVSP